MAEQEYQVTARKWRPVEFDSVVAQEHVTQTLKNAIRSGRLHHAYLFSGPRGVGKTTTARILAKALNCLNPSEDHEPCNECESCRAILEGRSMDVVEIDGASNNSVDDVRKLRENAKYPPVTGKYKLYVIDEVHMLSTSAFNALLKTLEEPPRHLVFVFATTEPHKVPATILSRCQRFDFRRMQVPDIVGRLKHIASHEGITIDDDALVVIASKADGSMRDSQSIFDQVVSFCGTSVTYQQANEALNLIDAEFFFRVTDMMRGHDTAAAFSIVDAIMRSGYDVQEFLIGLAEHFRNFLTILTTGSTALIETASGIRDRYGEESRQLEQGDIIRALHVTLAAQQAIRTSSQPRLRLELALVQLAVMDSTVSLAQLLERIDRLPEGGVQIPAAAPSAAAPPAAAPPAAAARPGGSPAPPAESRTGAAAGDLASFPTRPPAGTSMSAAVAEPLVAEMPSKEEEDERVAPVATASPSEPLGMRRSGHGTTVTPETTAARGPVPSLSMLQSRWSEFLRTCGEKRSLAAVLESLQPAEIAGGIVRVYVDNEAQRTMISRSKAWITERLAAFFGTALMLEGVVGVAPVPRSDGGSGAPAGSREHLDHPFVRGLVEVMGAVAV